MRNMLDTIDSNLSKKDISVEYVSRYSPCILAMLTKTNIADLSQNPNVTYVDYMPDQKGEDLSIIQEVPAPKRSITDVLRIAKILDDNSSGISGAQSTYGVTGAGVKIGQFENGVPNHSYVTTHPTYNTTTNHATVVCNIMKSAAPGATFYAVEDFTPTDPNNYSNYNNTVVNLDLPRIEWLLDQGVNIINVSWGFPNTDYYNKYTAFARWMDHIAYNHDVHVVEGSGNEGSAGVRSPAMAYNIITVGCTLLSDSNYNIAGYSSYNNDGASLSPARTFKPDISTTGKINTSGFTGGTSFSTPVITGTVALMCELQPSLKTKQHIVKAILATTVNKNYHKQVTPSTNAGNTDFVKYGAGIVDAKSACYCVSHSHYSTATGAVSSSTTTKTYDMVVTSSDTRMRISLAYANRVKFSGSNHTPVGSTPSATIGVLKIVIKDPSGNIVASCATEGSNLKVVEFTPTSYGTFKIIVTRLSGGTMNGSAVATNFGVAWR